MSCFHLKELDSTLRMNTCSQQQNKLKSKKISMISKTCTIWEDTKISLANYLILDILIYFNSSESLGMTIMIENTI